MQGNILPKELARQTGYINICVVRNFGRCFLPLGETAITKKNKYQGEQVPRFLIVLMLYD